MRYVELGQVDMKLGFCDITVATTYRGLLLIQAAFDSTPIIGAAVRHIVAQTVGTTSPLIIHDELQEMQRKLYVQSLCGFLGSAAFWDGLLTSKKALSLFPGDVDLLESNRLLRAGLRDRCLGLKAMGMKGRSLLTLSRMGKIYQKAYPWLDHMLNIRSAQLVKEVNNSLGSHNCEIRHVVFGPPVFGPERPPDMVKHSATDRDVGPLGIFATRDIREGDFIMTDKCLTGISQVPSSKLDHCDACHATLAMPFVHPNQIIRPNCCGKVAFCSKECYYLASKGYHTVLCGKDIYWVYENNDLDSHALGGTAWRPVMFLRIMAIVISDRNADIDKGKTPIHPLQHMLVARMAANYSPGEVHPAGLHDWQFFENIVAPTRILMLLGVDIFTEPDFGPEVVQTIYWRMENNVSISTFTLSPTTPTHSSSSTSRPKKKRNIENGEHKILNVSRFEIEEQTENTINMVCLNPNYLFFNHSCEPNVSWHGTVPDPSVGIEWLMGADGDIHKPGSSTIFCKAARDIAKGEDLKISYIGDPLGRAVVARQTASRPTKKGDGCRNDGDSADRARAEEERQRRETRLAKRKWMEKWFSGGCGCGICRRENEEREQEIRMEMLRGGENLERKVWEKMYDAL